MTCLNVGALGMLVTFRRLPFCHFSLVELSVCLCHLNKNESVRCGVHVFETKMEMYAKHVCDGNYVSS